MRRATLLLVAALTLSCDVPDTVKPFLDTIKKRLRPAAADLGKGPQACPVYQERGSQIAESAWVHDWPIFAPMLETPADPVADEAFCRAVILSYGAPILTKPKGFEHSTAVVFAVFLDPDFEAMSDRRQAATLCHESHHIVWQHRVGAVMAALDYASVTGRIVTEAIAYAWGDLILRRHGVTKEWLDAARLKRSKRFPTVYKLVRSVSPECVYGYLERVSRELEKRVGV